MNVVDSSAWLEYFADGPNAGAFARPIEAVDRLIVPTLSLFEVFKRVFILRGERAALEAVATMRQGLQADLDDAIALDAARLSIDHRLPLADSIMLATARAHGATLWTQDADFENLVGVRYFAKGGLRVNDGSGAIRASIPAVQRPASRGKAGPRART